ncbi:MAG: UDP-N-acetylmuramate dehydrogenase [Actinobacteria bacterium]|nr:UDP-N-acetylmuramate dehydrogenase [Actinomycetota bacterium]
MKHEIPHSEKIAELISELDKNQISYLGWVDLSKLSYAGIGGTAEILVEISSVHEAASFLSILMRTGLESKIIGSCSNIIFGDGILTTPLFRLCGEFSQVRVDGNVLRAGAAVTSRSASVSSKDSSLSGLEFLHDIPGRVGAAVKNNSGAFGMSISDVFSSGELLSIDGSILRASRDDLKFGYRSSNLAGDAIVLRAEFVLEGAPSREIEARLSNFSMLRRQSQPIGARSAGSVFKNPAGTTAALLIQECGLKGLRKGDAQISEKHANFIINLNRATFSDYVYLIDEIRRRVNEKFGILLETEVEIFSGES